MIKEHTLYSNTTCPLINPYSDPKNQTQNLLQKIRHKIFSRSFSTTITGNCTIQWVWWSSVHSIVPQMPSTVQSLSLSHSFVLSFIRVWQSIAKCKEKNTGTKLVEKKSTRNQPNTSRPPEISLETIQIDQNPYDFSKNKQAKTISLPQSQQKQNQAHQPH